MRLLVICSVLICSPLVAHADIYGYTDEAGTLVLSDVKQDNRYALLLQTEIAKNPALALPLVGGRINWANQKRYAALVAQTAQTYQLDEALLHALISTESGYEPGALSKKGAIGLMQVMPGTGKRYGARDLHDPTQNIVAGARYLRDLLRQFNNDLSLALAAYNAGENAVLRYGKRIPPYRETQQYVPRVLALYKKFQAKT
ncbi:MAG: lytic transglycosylase domain-containing protein [Burkholderiales bacterium]|nr:lytic transglycosylase domain-containing protein [Burkholderiales bacterium]